MQVREEQLVKALSEMESIAKGGNKEMPKSTAQSNGGFSTEGDKKEMSTTASEDEKVAKAVRKLGKWAKDDESSDSDSDSTRKAMKDEDDESSDSDSDSTSKACKALKDDESSDDESSESSDETSKSTIADLMKSDSVAGPVVDVSPFIERLVDQVSEAEYDLRKSLVQFQDEQGSYNKSIAKAVSAMGNLILEINNQLKGIGEEPAGTRKTILAKSEMADRFEESRPDFNKSQVLDALTEMAKSGTIQPMEVINYELSNHMEPHILRQVESFLRKSA